MRPQAKLILPALLALLTLALAGCQALYFLSGKGEKDALYTFPKEKRVLVFVDPRPTSGMPADLPYTLGDKIDDHLYRYHATDKLVGQQRLAEVRRGDNFDKMGIADVAKACDADIVLHIDVIQFVTRSTSDEQIAQGWTTVLVKVVDSNGNRLWPNEGSSLGIPIEARLEPSLTDQRDLNAIHKELMDMLTIRIGRMFHKYDLEDKTMTK